MTITRLGSTGVLLALLAAQATTQSPARRNFVACPIVQDTRTVPCWVSEYEGERYYLGIQTDISAEFHPPYLGHKALVEGVVSEEPRICGGIVLKPVRVSPLPEQDGSCNTILPAVDQFTVPFAPRPPGPSGGRLAFQAGPPPTPAARSKPAVEAREFELLYDFDMPVMGRHAGVLSQIARFADDIAARRVVITASRGSTLLSNGQVITENAGIAQARAQELGELLRGGGVRATIEVAPPSAADLADGIDDWRSRRATVRVEP